MSLDLLTIGDVCIDMYLAVEAGEVTELDNSAGPKLCFTHGSKIPVESIKTNVAGNAVNVAIGTKKLGLNTAIYAEMGNDEYADRISHELENYGIDTKYLDRNDEAETAIHPVIMFGGDRTIFSHHGKRNYTLKKWPKPKWVYYTSVSEGYEPFQKQLVEYFKANPDVGVAFNPGTYHMKTGLESLRNVLEVTHVLFVNKEEAMAFVGDGELKELHEKLQALGPKLTVITDGENGSSGSDGTNLYNVPIYTPESPILDRTGAGDAFSSGALSALFYGKPLNEVLAWGAVNASSTLTKVGAIHGLRTKEDMEKAAATLL